MSFEKVTPGKPLRIAANEWNALMDVARSHLRGQTSQLDPTPEHLRRNTGIAKVRNMDLAGEEDDPADFLLPRFAAVALRDPFVAHADNDAEFFRAPNFDCGVATAEDVAESPQKVAILLQPLAGGAEETEEADEIPGQIGDAVVSGIVPCLVGMQTEGDRFASLVEGETVPVSGSSGPIEILWSAAGTGEQWALVRLGGGSDTIDTAIAGNHVEGTTAITASDGIVMGEGDAEIRGIRLGAEYIATIHNPFEVEIPIGTLFIPVIWIRQFGYWIVAGPPLIPETITEAIEAALGCGLQISGDLLTVNSSDLAGVGLAPGTGCSLDVDVAEIADDIVDEIIDDIVTNIETGGLLDDYVNDLIDAAGGGTHVILDSTVHTDTTTGTVVRGDLITGQGATPKWTRLGIGTSGKVLTSDGTDISWQTPAGGSGHTIQEEGSDLTARSKLNFVGTYLTATDDAGNDATKVTLGTIGINGGGTGQTTATAAFDALSPTTTRGDLITRDASNNVRLGIGSSGKVLTSDGTDASWQTPAGNTLLDGSKHTDTVNQTASRGSLIVGNSTPAWTELTVGSADCYLTANSSGDAVWTTTAGITLSAQAYVKTASCSSGTLSTTTGTLTFTKGILTAQT